MELSTTSPTVIFDNKNLNWVRNQEVNYIFIKYQQNYFNDLLCARGHVFLNEVYDALGVPRTRDGALGGWFLEEGCNPITFEVDEGKDGAFSITIEIDGPIYDKI